MPSSKTPTSAPFNPNSIQRARAMSSCFLLNLSVFLTPRRRIAFVYSSLSSDFFPLLPCFRKPIPFTRSMSFHLFAASTSSYPCAAQAVTTAPIEGPRAAFDLVIWQRPHVPSNCSSPLSRNKRPISSVRAFSGSRTSSILRGHFRSGKVVKGESLDGRARVHPHTHAPTHPHARTHAHTHIHTHTQGTNDRPTDSPESTDRQPDTCS